MIRVALTGGIGSGKSTVARIFTTLGIPVYFADLEAKRLMQTDPALKSALIRLLGTAIYDEKGQLNRKKMADNMFGNPELVQAVNAIVHPAVYEDLKVWFNKQETDYAIYESALVKETHRPQVVDKIITVYAPRQVCMDRVMQRDHLSIHQVNTRMRRQQAGSQLLFADYLVINHNRTLIPQIWQIHRDLSQRAK